MKKLLTLIAIISLLFPGGLCAQWENTGTTTADHVRVEWKSLLDIRMRLNLSDLHLKPGQAVEIIPLLQGERDTVELPRVLVNGRTRDLIYQRNGGTGYEGYQQVVRRKNGTEQSVDYAAQLMAEKWMDGAEIVLMTDLCGCGWRTIAPAQRSSIARVEAPKKPEFRPLLAYIAPVREEVKAREKSGNAFLDFPVNQTTIHPDYRNNPRELGKIRATIDSVHTDKYATITEVFIKGYASPEGAYAANARLAEGRANALLAYVKGLYHFEGVSFRVDSEPEDWEGLERMVEQSGLSEKEALLAVIRDGKLTDADLRERKMRQIAGGEPYRYLLRNFYPALRHSDYTVKYVIRNFTVEEARELIFSDPKQLSLDEMYRVAQSYESGSAEFCEVFEIAVRMYPDDPVSNLNAANTALLRKDVEAARRYLSKAEPGEEKELAEKALVQLEQFLKEE